MSDIASIDDVLSKVAADVALRGVAKTGRNQQQGYNFRGIDDVLNAVGPALAKNGVSVTARFSDRTVDKIQAKSGGTLFNVVVTGEFTYWWRGEHRTTVTIGEAMDSGDKATNKAMAMAAKYAHILTLSIPLVGSDDADLRAHAAGNGNGADHAPASRLDALEDSISQNPPADPPPAGDAPAGGATPSSPAGARPLASYAKTKEGWLAYIDDMGKAFDACSGADAKALYDEHASDIAQLMKSRNPDISGGGTSLVEAATAAINHVPASTKLMGG